MDCLQLNLVVAFFILQQTLAVFQNLRKF